MTVLRRRPKGRGAPSAGIKPSPAHRDWYRVVCVGGGPSFSMEQALLLRTPPPGWRVMVCNTSWERVPGADLLYAGDGSWWRMYHRKVLLGFKGECWTADRGFAHRFGIHHIKHSAERGLSRVPNVVFTGGNSGHVLINLAYHFGARQILLVGYDFQDTYGMSHWHGDHPEPLNQQRNYPQWIEYMDTMAPELAAEGVQVTNCSPVTALTCYPRGDLAQCLS